MPQELNGGSKIKEDKKLAEGLLHVIAEYTAQPLHKVEAVSKIVRSYDKTIIVCLNADKYKEDAEELAHKLNQMLVTGDA